MHKDSNREEILGTIFTMSAFFLWGFLPLYFNLGRHISPLEILAYRITGSFFFSWLYLWLTGKLGTVKEIFRSRKKILIILLRAILLGANWLIFIYGVFHDQLVATSLGYYINPLLSVFLGMIILKERLTKLQFIAFILAVVGVTVYTLSYGRLPWISLSLAFSFALYGLFKKTLKVEAGIGLGLEMLFILPLGLSVIVLFEIQGWGHFTETALSPLFFTGVGLLSLLPLLAFAHGTVRIPLSRVGFIQYLTPSLHLLTGVFVYGEPFSSIEGLSFGIIWIALALYSYSLVKKLGHRRYKGAAGRKT